MAFCTECGHQLAEGAKFCYECGTAVNGTKFSDSKRKTVYEGNLRKCPNCGEIIKSFESNCPSCGLEFRDTNTVYSAIKELSKKLIRTNSSQKRGQVIRDFYIPNTKEDITEFFILAAFNIEAEDGCEDAWLAKMEQVYSKAKLSLGNNSDFNYINQLYTEAKEKLYKKAKLKRNRNNFKRASRFTSKLAGFLGNTSAYLLQVALKSIPVIGGVLLLLISIKIDQRGENSSLHELIGVTLLIVSASYLKRRNASFSEILLGFGSGVAAYQLSNYLDNGSLLLLGGLVIMIITTVSFFKKLIKKT